MSAPSSDPTPPADPTPRPSPAQDLRAGFLVFLIALPLCLGIAMASGFPPVAGILTAIVGGVLVTLLGSSRLTIKGPAAGLIVIAIGAVTELGGGDMALGYQRALAVGVVAAAIQIVFALLRTASIGVAMSPSVVHGMLAAIGVIIISKQVHTVVGVTPEAKEPLELLAEIPHSVMHANPEILVLGGVSLLILFGWPLIKTRWAKPIPPPLVALLVTVPLAAWFDLDHQHHYTIWSHDFEVGPEFLVNLPSNILEALTFPDFSVVFEATSLKYIVMFALVGTIESTLSVLAVDSLDPERRASNLDRDLLATGAGNLVCAFLGGLPMISEIVRSKANIDAGARSGLANFTHGALLLGFVALAPGLLHMIPLAALGAMLVYTGSRLAAPNQLVHARQIGGDQLLLFTTTLVVTLATDLLVGVAVGLLLKVVLHLLRGASIRTLFRPRIDEQQDGTELRIGVHGTAAFTALLPIRKRLRKLTPETDRVLIDLSGVELVDHTFLNRLEDMSRELPDAVLEVVGVDHLEAASTHPQASRRRQKA